LGVDDHAFLLEQPRQRVVVGERGNLRSEARRRLRPRVPLLLRERALELKTSAASFTGRRSCSLGEYPW
jgi:hypothetical protein